MKYIIAALTLIFPSVVLAHSGHDHTSLSVGLAGGFLHPLLGLDHLLTLIAVGVLSVRIEGKQKYMIPLSFMALMLVGFFTAHSSMHLISTGTVEMLILVSLIAAGVFVVLGHSLLRSGVFNKMAAWTVTCFAAVHGLAHGLEIPAGADAQGFTLGFTVMGLSIMAVTIAGHSILNKSFMGKTT
jgi:urease accessory protein